jgi:hypothetical protein
MLRSIWRRRFALRNEPRPELVADQDSEKGDDRLRKGCHGVCPNTDRGPDNKDGGRAKQHEETGRRVVAVCVLKKA